MVNSGLPLLPAPGAAIQPANPRTVRQLAGTGTTILTVTCPHCRERIRAIRRPEACPHCDRPLVDGDGRALRTVDEDYPDLRARLDAKSLKWLKQGSLVGSTSEALRLIAQGAVRIDGERLEDPKLAVPCGQTHLFQVGKRKFARITVG